MPKHETQNTYYWMIWEVNSLVIKIWPVYVILQNKIFH